LSRASRNPIYRIDVASCATIKWSSPPGLQLVAARVWLRHQSLLRCLFRLDTFHHQAALGAGEHSFSRVSKLCGMSRTLNVSDARSEGDRRLHSTRVMHCRKYKEVSLCVGAIRSFQGLQRSRASARLPVAGVLRTFWDSQRNPPSRIPRKTTDERNFLRKVHNCSTRACNL